MGKEQHIVVRYRDEYTCTCGAVATVGYWCMACLHEQTKHATREELEEAAMFMDQLLKRGEYHD